MLISFFKKITISIVVFFVVYLQLVPRVSAEPVTFAPGFDAIKYLGSLILLSQGLRVTSENALNAFASDFSNQLSQVDKDQMLNSAINTGLIGVSPSVAILSKTYVKSLLSKTGEIEYRGNLQKVVQQYDYPYWNNVFFAYNYKDLSNFPTYTSCPYVSSVVFVGANDPDDGIIVAMEKSPCSVPANSLNLVIRGPGVHDNFLITSDTLNLSVDVKPEGVRVFTPFKNYTFPPNLVYRVYPSATKIDLYYTLDNFSYTINEADYSIDDLYPHDLTYRKIAVPVPADGTAIDSLSDLVGKNYRDLSISEPMAGDVPFTDIDILNNIWVSLYRFFDLSIPVNWEPMKAVGVTVTNKFPFSLPWDVARGVQGLEATAERPKVEGDWKMPWGDTVHLKIEVPQWMDPIFSMIRGAVVVLFVAGLIFAHGRLMGGQK